MFLSIRWKAVILSTLMLLAIMLAWVSHSVYQNINAYQQDIQTAQLQQEAVLDLLISDNAIKLGQYGQLIASLSAIQTYNADDEQQGVLTDFIQTQWFSWNLNFGIDTIAVFNQDMELLADAHQIEDPSLYKRTYDILSSSLQTSSQTPYHFTLCLDGCSQFVVEPFIFDDGHLGYMVLGQSLIDVVLRFQAITTKDIAVLIPQAPNELGHFLPAWNASIWAVTQPENSIPIISDYSNKNTLDMMALPVLSQVWKNDFLINYLSPASQEIIGEEGFFISIEDSSPRQQQLRTEIINNVFIGIVGWVFTELLLLLLMFWPIKRLLRVVDALNLLPKQEYKKAESMVHTGSPLIYDELIQLEQSTLYLAKELSSLKSQVEISEDQLNSQITMLTRSKDFLQRLFDNANIHILTQTLDYRFKSHNKLFVDCFASQPALNFLELLSRSHDKTQFEDGINKLKTQLIDSYQHEVSIHSLVGDLLTVAWTHSLVKDDDGNTQILSIGMDITQRKKDELALSWLANNDTLTGIGNRRAFSAALDLLLSNSNEGAVVFIDVNRFKQINDIYGHHAGDMVLIDLANELKNATREQDFVCRLAGDEFTVILQDVNKEQLTALLIKLSSHLRRSFLLSDQRQIEYSVSLGAALFPEHGQDEQKLIVNSDLAMYKAKKKGLNCWHVFDFSDDQLIELQQEHALMKEVRHALEQNSFTLNFQPIFNIQSNKVEHYEVLLRLTSQQGQFVSPALFIPIAERGGLIREVDLWVIEHTFSFLNTSRVSHPNLVLGINVSAPSLQDPDFIQDFKSLMARHHILPERVIVEITETSYIDNFQQVLDSVNKLNTLGVEVALDDFGVGYSSFSYMKELPLKYVKLDGSYVKDLENSPQNRAFIKSVVVMAKAFGMETIAEFVESQAVIEILKELDVDYAQGYYIGKPALGLLNEN